MRLIKWIVDFLVCVLLAFGVAFVFVFAVNAETPAPTDGAACADGGTAVVLQTGAAA